MAKGLIALGLEPRHSVAILGYNSAEWFLADLAAVFAGGVAVGIYETSGEEVIQHILEDSKVKLKLLFAC